jgi:hypothetical protein
MNNMIDELSYGHIARLGHRVLLKVRNGNDNIVSLDDKLMRRYKELINQS